MDEITGNNPPPPPYFLFWIHKVDLPFRANTKFQGFLTVGYFLNGLYVLDVTVTLSDTLLCL